ncbi:MAG: terminase, partial [Pseudomonadota bacterium]|nr:terminase [Pseudomonadota bacterium]
SFLSIKKALTGSGRQMTLVANRSAATGHADVAWAVMNALEAAPIADSTDQQIQGARKARIKVFS